MAMSDGRKYELLALRAASPRHLHLLRAGNVPWACAGNATYCGDLSRCKERPQGDRYRTGAVLRGVRAARRPGRVARAKIIGAVSWCGPGLTAPGNTRRVIWQDPGQRRVSLPIDGAHSAIATTARFTSTQSRCSFARSSSHSFVNCSNTSAIISSSCSE